MTAGSTPIMSSSFSPLPTDLTEVHLCSSVGSNVKFRLNMAADLVVSMLEGADTSQPSDQGAAIQDSAADRWFGSQDP